jgi:hypothetical protein
LGKLPATPPAAPLPPAPPTPPSARAGVVSSNVKAGSAIAATAASEVPDSSHVFSFPNTVYPQPLFS